jgi:hypothetical protein
VTTTTNSYEQKKYSYLNIVYKPLTANAAADENDNAAVNNGEKNLILMDPSNVPIQFQSVSDFSVLERSHATCVEKKEKCNPTADLELV